MPLNKSINTATVAICSTSSSFPSSTLPARWPSSQWRRSYATMPNDGAWPDSSPSDDAKHNQPGWTQAQHPTPYDIFDIRRGAPYTKTRFYQLVKLYHPDKHDQPPTTASVHRVSHAVRLERYHLIVAANELLSDPAKRNLYDTYGLGWTVGRAPSRHESFRAADRSWRDKPGNAAANATWEDWERWYAARAGNTDTKYREPVYMSHGMFAALIVIMGIIGGIVQTSRAESRGSQYVEMRAAKHGAIASDIRKNAVAAAGRDKHERVDTFLRDREHVAYLQESGKVDESPPSSGEKKRPRDQA